MRNLHRNINYHTRLASSQAFLENVRLLAFLLFSVMNSGYTVDDCPQQMCPVNTRCLPAACPLVPFLLSLHSRRLQF